MTEKKVATRAFEMSIDLDASLEEVWRALTVSDELVRWFPLSAHVTPGEGGTMRWSWGEGWSGEARIDLWEPLKRLRLVEDRRQSFDAEGRLLPDGPDTPVPLAVELTIESHAGRTRLRLVHSGFETGPGWDDEFEGVSAGWQYELRSLRHYLERHLGRNRNVGWARTATALAQPEVWATLTGARGFHVSAGDSPGEPFRMTAGGDTLTGTVLLSLPQGDLSAVVGDLDDGVFRLSTHRAAGQTGVSVWLATYRESDIPRVNAFANHAQDLLNQLFPQ